VRQSATNNFLERYVARLENENEFLRAQISVKDVQIKDLTVRGGETNVLIHELQKMFMPLLGKGGERSDARDKQAGADSL
jgi:hypothetical protein